MKIDISIPNPVYRAAEMLAQELGVSLSELYTAALTAYVNEHEKKNIPENVGDLYITGYSTADNEMVEMQIVAEFNAWDAASDEALENFEKGLEES